MNNPPFGVARQLFRTSYSPNLDISRPSSLNNNNSAHSFHQQIPLIRPDSNSHVFVVRQLAKNNLTNSQVIQQDYKIKLPPPQYYSEPNKPDDIIKKIDQKLEELNKKIAKNSEDIKILKSLNKNILNPQISYPQEFEKMNKRQQTHHQQCLNKIRTLKDELTNFSSKIQSGPSQYFQKNTLIPDEKQMIKIKNLIEDRIKQETSKIKLIIENETSKISNQLRWELKGSSINPSPIKSRLKYPFRSTQIVYKQFVQTFKIEKDKSLSPRQNSDSPRSGKVIESSEKTFYVDRQGFLLDEDNYYLLDKQEKMIRLTSVMLQKLHRQGLLKD